MDAREGPMALDLFNSAQCLCSALKFPLSLGLGLRQPPKPGRHDLRDRAELNEVLRAENRERKGEEDRASNEKFVCQGRVAHALPDCKQSGAQNNETAEIQEPSIRWSSDYREHRHIDGQGC
jgi:hypothetical protein